MISIMDFKDLSYRDLQTIAKNIGMPANAKREYLIKGMEAKRDNNSKTFETLLSLIKARVKRKKKSSGSEARRRSKRIKSLPQTSTSSLKNQIVDTTSATELSHHLIYDENRQDSSWVEPCSIAKDAYLVSSNKLILSSAESQSVSKSMSDNTAENFSPGNLLPNESSAMVPYKSQLPMDNPQIAPQIDDSLHSNLLNSFYRRQSCQQLSEIRNSYSSSNDSNNCCLQLSCPGYYESVPLQNYSTYQQETLPVCRVSKNTYTFHTSQNGPVEVDCGADLSSTIPQQEKSVENCRNASVDWCRGSLVSADSERMEFNSNNTAVDYSVQRNLTSNNVDGDATSILVEFDSASDAESVSLPNDVINFLDSAPPVSSDIANYYSKSLHPITYTVPADYRINSIPYANEFSNIASDHSAYTTQYTNVCENLPNNGNYENSHSPELPNGNAYPLLPSFSSFFANSTHESVNDHAYASYQPTVRSGFYDMPVTSPSVQIYPNLNGSCPSNYSYLDHDHVDVTWPDSINQPRFERTYSHIQENQHMQFYPSRCAEVESFSYGPSTLNGLCSNHSYSSFAENDYRLPNSENDFVRFENGNAISDAELLRRKHETARLIYEKQTVHHSKILHDNPTDKGVEENVIRELVQIYIPSSSQKNSRFQPNKVSSENNSEKEKLSIPAPLYHTCSYKKDGCNFISNFNAVREHEESCRFQPIHCPTEFCTWHESIYSLSHHIFECHKIENRNEGVYKIDRKNLTNPNDLFHTFYHFHKNIIYVIKLHTFEDVCIATVQYIPQDRLPILKNNNIKGIMKLISFPSGKVKVKPWKGAIQPYLGYDDGHNKYSMNRNHLICNTEQRHQKNISTLALDITKSEFVILYVSVT